jgi:4-hydroxybenzoate polyprenyltransferase
MFRIVHPFPTTLDALMTALFVIVAGGTPAVALRLGAAMFALQAGIGTANDLIDEPMDRGLRARKPLPAGLLSRHAAGGLLVVALAVGLALSALSGWAVLAVAVLGTSIGLVYDRWLKGTVWSWLAFALGVPVLPVYAWLGATGSLPGSFAVLIPAAILAGAALALANLRADLGVDLAAGADTAATRLGPRRTWLASALLHGAVVAVAVGSLIIRRGGGPGLAVAAAAVAVIGAGTVLGRRGPAGRLERAWELQAAGVGLLAAGWVWAFRDAGAL